VPHHTWLYLITFEHSTLYTYSRIYSNGRIKNFLNLFSMFFGSDSLDVMILILLSMHCRTEQVNKYISMGGKWEVWFRSEERQTYKTRKGETNSMVLNLNLWY
jgi:hypothetical protein